MKYPALLALLAASLNAQWITGHYAAQNGVLSVSNIPWNKYTHIVHFAAAPNPDGSVNMYYLIQAEINSLISSRPAGKKVVVCIKDNDSNYNAFSQATATGTIASFVNNIVTFVNTNQYDGVDIDWEQNVNIGQYEDLLARLRSALPAKVIAIDTGNWNSLQTVAGASASLLDQVNVMCYDMDGPANGYSWYNDALLQNGNAAVMTCDWRVRSLTSAGVPNSKIGIGIPFYTRRWPGITQALTNGNFTIATYPYRTLASDSTRWQPQYQFYDSGYKANYLSIPSLDEFDSYNGPQFIADAVAWQKAQGFGGFMTFTLDYEYLSNQSGDASHPLSTALYSAAMGGGAPIPGPVISLGAPAGTLSASIATATLSVATNVNATCRYATSTGMSYNAMPNVFSVTGGTAHSSTLVGLQSGTAYNYYVRCSDTSGDVDSTDYPVAFSIAAPTVSGPVGFFATPNSGSGASQNFAFQVSDSSSPIQQMDAVFDSVQGRANSCQVELWVPTQTVFLKSDDNTTWSQATLGSATILKNTQCSLNVGASSLSALGSSASLSLAMSFASSYAGTRSLLGFASDQAGLSSAWQTLGSWTIPAAPVQPLTLQVTPVNGYGATATFALTVTDVGGASAVQETALFLGDSLGATYSCYIDYWATSKTVSLRNDTNTAWSQGIVGSSTVLQNSQCSVSLGSASVSSSGNSLTLSLHVSFTRHYLGVKQMFAFGADQTARTTGWQNPGTWTVPRQK